MSRISIFICLLVFAIAFSNALPAQVNDLTKGISQFSLDFYSECVKTKPGNVIISPLSVANALALLSQGSTGKTFEEISNGLHLTDDRTIAASQFFEQRVSLEKNIGDATLSIANQIYVQRGYKLNRSFQNVAISKFKSCIDSLNFAESAKSAKIINQFVEAKTNGKIKDLISPDLLTSDTRSVLVNAIYFKGNWEHPFEKEYTRKGDFYISETDKVPVDVMYTNDQFNFAFLDELDSTALEMKYANSNLSFVIVLPFSRTGLTAVETKLKDYDLSKITDNMHERNVDVFLPKFKVEYEINLNDVLKNLGMSEMFAESGNLNGILESGEPLKVSDVVHKAFIEINEEGAEAAAATGMVMVSYSMPPQFNVNHPFMYFIRDTQTNTIIFSGRVEKF